AGGPLGIENTDASLPATFALHQNYPNPFNPSTVISYQLSVKSDVTLKVYNLIGVEVATLVDGVQDAGYKSVSWDASNVTSGVYFYRLQSSSFIETRSLILMK
ncbi:MAG: T9SS type A sorting domain-containing protein, partial [Ignavibacteriae bacterium]|nr:T9SS type A sorting domain-containing protein [Ignavibacteriota bacterium]